MPIATQRVLFDGPGGRRLAGRFEPARETPRAIALFAHCFTCSKDIKSTNRISRRLAERNIATLRFGFTGIGDSEGDFADTNFTTNCADLRAAVSWVQEQYGGPHLLIGHSLGGAAALAVADEFDSVRAVATLAAPSEVGHLGEKLRRMSPAIEREGAAQIDVMGRVVEIKRQMLDDFARHDLLSRVRELRRPLLILHAPDDHVIDVGHGYAIFNAAPGPKSFVALDGAEHLLIRDPRDATYAADLIATWAERYLGPSKPDVAS